MKPCLRCHRFGVANMIQLGEKNWNMLALGPVAPEAQCTYIHVHVEDLVLQCTYLNAGSTGQPLSVAHHTHVVSVLLQLAVVTDTAIQTREALLLTSDPTAGVAAG